MNDSESWLLLGERAKVGFLWRCGGLELRGFGGLVDRIERRFLAVLLSGGDLTQLR